MSTACERAALVEALFDGRLGASDAASTARHLKGCAACAELLRELTSLRQLLVSDVSAPSPFEHQHARLSLLRNSAETSTKRRRPAALLVAVLVALPVAGLAAASPFLPLGTWYRAATFSAHVAPSPALEPRHDPRRTRASVAVAPPPMPATSSTVVAPIASVLPRTAPQVAVPKPGATPVLSNTSPASKDFADAMLALSRGDFSASANKLHDFAASYPRDGRVEDAIYLEAIALERAGRLSDAEAAARRYLMLYPAGAHRAPARRIVGE